MGKGPTYRQGVIAIAVAATIWSLMGLLIRLAGDVGTWQVLLYRSLAMVPVILLLLSRSGGSPVAKVRATGWSGMLAGLSLVGAFSGAIFAIQSTSVANAVFLFSAAPLLSAIMAMFFLREHVRAHTWIAIAFALFGIFLIVREGLSAGAGQGNLAALVSATCFSIFTVMTRRIDTIPAILLGGVFSAIFAAIMIYSQGSGFSIPPVSLAICLVMGVVNIGVGMSLFSYGGRSVPAAEMGLLALLEVLLAPVWVWLFLGETASGAIFAGGAVVLGAIILNTIAGQFRKADIPAPL